MAVALLNIGLAALVVIVTTAVMVVVPNLDRLHARRVARPRVTRATAPHARSARLVRDPAS